MRADLLVRWRQITKEGGSGHVGQVKAGQNRINSLFAAAARACLPSHQPTLYSLSSQVQASHALGLLRAAGGPARGVASLVRCRPSARLIYLVEERLGLCLIE